jgi:DNA processing protein
VITFQNVQQLSIDPTELVAMSLIRSGADTRACRLFRSLIFPAATEASVLQPGWALRRLVELLGVPTGELAEVVSRALDRARAACRSADAAALTAVTVQEPAYPALLREIPDPPLVVWVRGAAQTLMTTPLVAVVGSRNATTEGVLMARRLGLGLSRAGVGVVSGLARGIDGAAHQGALEGPTPTIAVLGNGADSVYPPSHRSLAAAVAGQGCLVSEFAPGTPPLPVHFPLRNRIISGLSRAVVVVEASERSGSLITARMALEQGRDVLAVPGAIAAGCHRGCHALIKDGARLVETVEDVLEEIDYQGAPGRSPEKDGKPLFDSWLAEAIPPGETRDPDALALATRRAPGDVLAELSRLEVAGFIRRVPGGKFVRLD